MVRGGGGGDSNKEWEEEEVGGREGQLTDVGGMDFD